MEEGVCRTFIQGKNINAVGIELNSKAVASAKTKGINIRQLDLHELAEEKESSFDAVCSFQVLEHISDPLMFFLGATKTH